MGLLPLLKLNAREWPFIALGILGSFIEGVAFPLFAIFFGEVLSVSLCVFTWGACTYLFSCVQYSRLSLLACLVQPLNVESVYVKCWLYVLYGPKLSCFLRISGHPRKVYSAKMSIVFLWSQNGRRHTDCTIPSEHLCSIDYFPSS